MDRPVRDFFASRGYNGSLKKFLGNNANEKDNTKFADFEKYIRRQVKNNMSRKVPKLSFEVSEI